MAARRRAALYVDGFNFYYSVRNHFKPGQDARGFSLSGLCWCDFRALVERHYLPKDHDLVSIRYFTAPVTEKVESTLEEHKRYDLWLRAARTIPGLEVISGFYRKGENGKERQEKETDVNLAVELLLDGLEDIYDCALVLSGDADQIPAIVASAVRLPKAKFMRVLLPPGHHPDDWTKHYLACARQMQERGRQRHQAVLKQVAAAEIGCRELAASLLRYELDGVSCPHYWRLPAKYLEANCPPHCRPDR